MLSLLTCLTLLTLTAPNLRNDVKGFDRELSGQTWLQLIVEPEGTKEKRTVCPSYYVQALSNFQINVIWFVHRVVSTQSSHE